MGKIKVSVVIPCYNVENYLEKCLDSIINQTLKEIEIIVVNDGSTDSTLKILKEYLKKDDRIILIDQKNSGLATSRNNGTDKATGKYIYYIDSDDYLDLTALEELYEKLEKEKLDTLFFDSKVIYESDNLKDTTIETEEYYSHDKEYEKVYSGQELFAKMMQEDTYRESSCMQINKLEFLRKNDIRFIDGIIHEDVYFTLKVMTLAKKVSYICKKFYNRLYREGSIMTSTKALNRLNGCFKSLLEIIKTVNENVDKEHLESFLERERALQNNCITMYRKSSKDDLEEYKNKLPIDERNNFKLLVENITRKQIYINELENKNKELENVKTEKEKLETENKKLEEEIEHLEIKLKEQDSIKFLIKKRIKTRINRLKRKKGKR